MHAFQYHRPTSSKEALALAQQKSEGRYLAGGQSLVQAMKLRLSSPSDLIDLGKIGELTGIKVSGNAVEIAAMTRHAEVAASQELKRTLPSLAAMAGLIGDRQFHHAQPVRIGRVGSGQFMRRPSRGDKQNPVQSASLSRLAGHAEVPVVDRIECPAEESESQRGLYGRTLISMLRNSACIAGPLCSCSAMTPDRLTESCRSAVTMPFSLI